jgi:hypothetical protein
VITLLISLVLIALLWYIVRTIFQTHPRAATIAIVIDVLFVLVAIVVIARFAGVL